MSTLDEDNLDIEKPDPTPYEFADFSKIEFSGIANVLQS